MKNIDFKILFAMLDKGDTAASVFHIGSSQIMDFKVLHDHYDRHALTKRPKDVEDFYKTLGFKEVVVGDINQFDSWPDKSFDLVFNAGASSVFLDQVKFFNEATKRVAPGGFFLNVVPSLSVLDHEFFSYKPHFFNYIADSLDFEIRNAWFANYSLERFLETKIYPEFSAGRYEAELGINWFQNENWTTHIGLGVSMQKRIKDVQEDD